MKKNMMITIFLGSLDTMHLMILQWGKIMQHVVFPLGLKMSKIHPCPNDYILYSGEEYENLDAYPICSASQYKITQDDPSDVEGKHLCQGDMICSYNTMLETLACKATAMAQSRS